MLDFTAWVSKYEGKIFRMWEYKKMFTPYEQQQAFNDEDIYRCNIATYVTIKEAYKLPDGDILLGIQILDEYKELKDKSPDLYFRKLSEIELFYFSKDQLEQNWK